MLRLGKERFDHAVAMDSLIHYEARDMLKVIALLAGKLERSLLFTFIPRTPLLVAMHAVGRLFPKGDRSPHFRPLGEHAMRDLLAGEAGLSHWCTKRTKRISRGFYTSQALELSIR
jgi:magnesium-protoporphyrin O-methyltransferase